MPRQPRVTTHLDHSDGDPTPATERRQRRVKRSQRPQPASRPTLRGGSVCGGGSVSRLRPCRGALRCPRCQCAQRARHVSGLGGDALHPKIGARTSSSTSSMTQAATAPRPFKCWSSSSRNSGRGLQLHHGGQGRRPHRDHRPCEHRVSPARRGRPGRHGGVDELRPPAELAVRRRRDPRRRPGGPHGPGRAAASEAAGRPAVLLGTAGHRAGVGGRARLQRAGVHRRHPRLAVDGRPSDRDRRGQTTDPPTAPRTSPRPSATRGCAYFRQPKAGKAAALNTGIVHARHELIVTWT